MALTVLSTKLSSPRRRAQTVSRPGLLRRLTEAVNRLPLTLISAPAGFGKSTLLVEWAATREDPVAWLSLEEDDGDPLRFLTYFVAAINRSVPELGADMLRALEAIDTAGSMPSHTILTPLINEIAAFPHPLVLVLDDYHTVDAREIDDYLEFILEHAPPNLHVVLTGREDPGLPLPRMRARGDVVEFRARDLRFSLVEAQTFINDVMQIDIEPERIAALEERTEGWIAGLQMAAISLRDHDDPDAFVRDFSGNHRYVLDYLLDEVLIRQPAAIQRFLVRTAILDRLSAPLCDAVVDDPESPGEETLTYLDRSNLFLVSLDTERRWFRYHHLFADLLRHRIDLDAAVLHGRAARWLYENDEHQAAFRHATAAADVSLALSILENDPVPIYARGYSGPVLRWLEELDEESFRHHPELAVHLGWCLWITHRSSAVHAAIQRAESALSGGGTDAPGVMGQVSALRAMLAANEYDTAGIIEEGQRALALLAPENLYVRTAVTRTLAVAYHFDGRREDARGSYHDAIGMCRRSGNTFIEILATTGLGLLEESDLHLGAAETAYRRVIELAGDPSLPVTCEAHSGLGRIAYQRDELNLAEEQIRRGAGLAKQIESIDSHVAAEIFAVRIALARGDRPAAAAEIERLAREVERNDYIHQKEPLARVQIAAALAEADLDAASELADRANLPIARARVAIGRGDSATALALLEPVLAEMRTRRWTDRIIEAELLLAIAQCIGGDNAAALRSFRSVAAATEPEGIVRLVLDEGEPVRALLKTAHAENIHRDYAARFLALLGGAAPAITGADGPKESLSRREREVLTLLARGLSNGEIAEHLFVSISTVKGHNYRIFEKLGVDRRTQAVARARALGII